MQVPRQAETINRFEGQWRFLSNFSNDPVTDPTGIVWPTAEHLYQACKTVELPARVQIWDLETPGRAKRAGRYLPLRDDWEQVKYGMMAWVLGLKFNAESPLAERLTDTYPARLQEGNTWGDQIWGVYLRTGEGQNWLGWLLELRRDWLLDLRASIYDRMRDDRGWDDYATREIQRRLRKQP